MLFTLYCLLLVLAHIYFFSNKSYSVHSLISNFLKFSTVLRQLSHENIVRFVGVSINHDPITRDIQPVSIVTELCENGDLFDYIRKNDPPEVREMLTMMHVRRTENTIVTGWLWDPQSWVLCWFS